MEGGNEVSVSERNYAFAVRRTKCWMCAYQNDAAENLPRMDSVLGVQLDGSAVKEKAEASKNLKNSEPPSAPLDRGCVSRRRGAAPSPRCRAPANNRSRWSLALFQKPLNREVREVMKGGKIDIG